MNMIKIPEHLTITWIREQYKNHSLTPEELLKEIADRVKKDERMNIWITPPNEEQTAFYLSQLKSMDIDQYPLWGIPFAIKDNIDVKGVPTTAACQEYAYLPKESARVVQKLIKAGAIPLGKTNLDQFATGLVGTRSPYGETHNAYKEELISGGSSAGSAISVARGQAAFSLGTDTAGSGRVPAALNNLYGLKPSVGAWSIKGVVPACNSLDCITVFGNTMEDCLSVDAAVRGYEKEDPWSKDIPAVSARLPKKICLPKKMPAFFGPYKEDYEEAWNRTIERLIQLNAEIEFIDYTLFEKAAKILYEGAWIAERWADLGEFVQSHTKEVFPVTKEILESGGEEKLKAASVFKAIHQLEEYKVETKKLLSEAVLVMPTAGGTWTREAVRKDPIKTNTDMGMYTNHCNLLDLCACSIPIEFAAENLPFGITAFSLSEQEGLIVGLNELLKEKSTLIAVCGLHMRGFPLEKQMKEHGAKFIREDNTTPMYQMIKIPSDPPKPGLIRRTTGGCAIQVEIWEMPNQYIGDFINKIPVPLGLGQIELNNGSYVCGFLCEEYAADRSEDISKYGSWRQIPS